MDDNSHSRIARFLERYPILLLVLGWSLGAVMLGSWVGSGDAKNVLLILAAGAAVAALILLRDKYWLFIPFGFSFQLVPIPLGNRTYELAELVVCFCTASLIARHALKAHPFTLFRPSHVPVLLYIGWAALIFITHPVGLMQTGSAVGGARFYAKLIMAFAAFLIMANQTITNRDCLWILALIIVGWFFCSVQNILLFFFGRQVSGLSMSEEIDPESIYSWHQNLVLVPLVVVPILFARYKGSEMFSLKRPWVLAVLLLCTIVTLLSGKRAGIFSIPLCAISAAIIRKEWGALMLWVGAAILAMAMVVIGQGNIFKLPLTMQRTLSWLPADWDSQLEDLQGGADPFRTRMRELAMDRIKRDPWIGRGYQVDLNLLNQALGSETNYLERVCLFLAIGSSWHNTWLGHAADFGIPGSVLQAVVYLQVILLGLWLIKRLPPASGFQIIAFYVTLFTIRDVANSWTSGQSAIGPYDRFWMYGMLVSFAVMIKQKKTREQGPVEESNAPQIGSRRPLPVGFGGPLPRPILRPEGRNRWQ